MGMAAYGVRESSLCDRFLTVTYIISTLSSFGTKVVTDVSNRGEDLETRFMVCHIKPAFNSLSS